MIICPFCHFNNEDGALFCEQCKSDLSGVPSAAAAPAVAVVEPIAAVPVEAIAAEPVLEVQPIAVEPIAVEPVAVEPIAAVEAVAVVEPMAVEPIAVEPVAPPPPPPPPPPPVVEAPPAPPPPPPPPPPAPAPPPVMAAPPPPAPAPAPVAAAPAEDAALPTGAQPKLVVLRGQRRNAEYPIYEGLNFIGRADDKPVDIDLEDQEPPDRVWCSRQHAVIELGSNRLTLEDLNSSNGTYLNRNRVFPGQKQTLKVNDIIQIGNVQLKVVV